MQKGIQIKSSLSPFRKGNNPLFEQRCIIATCEWFVSRLVQNGPLFLESGKSANNDNNDYNNDE